MHGNQHYMINIESCDLIILPQSTVHLPISEMIIIYCSDIHN